MVKRSALLCVGLLMAASAPSAPNGDEIGERSLFHKRPALSELGAVGNGGLIRSRMRFSGRIEGGVLILRCADDDGSCPDATLHFKA